MLQILFYFFFNFLKFETMIFAFTALVWFCLFMFRQKIIAIRNHTFADTVKCQWHRTCRLMCDRHIMLSVAILKATAAEKSFKLR